MLVARKICKDEHGQRRRHRHITQTSSTDDPCGSDSHDPDDNKPVVTKTDDGMPQAIGEGRTEHDLEPILGEEAPVHDL
jgi:hypothetical protein